MNETVTIRMTEDEAELAILALDTYRRHHLAEYDEEDRGAIRTNLTNLARKLRDA